MQWEHLSVVKDWVRQVGAQNNVVYAHITIINIHVVMCFPYTAYLTSGTCVHCVVVIILLQLDIECT